MSSISCSVRASGSFCRQKSIIMRESFLSLMSYLDVRESAPSEMVPSKCCMRVSGERSVWYCRNKVTRRQDSGLNPA